MRAALLATHAAHSATPAQSPTCKQGHTLRRPLSHSICCRRARHRGLVCVRRSAVLLAYRWTLPAVLLPHPWPNYAHLDAVADILLWPHPGRPARSPKSKAANSAVRPLAGQHSRRHARSTGNGRSFRDFGFWPRVGVDIHPHWHPAATLSSLSHAARYGRTAPDAAAHQSEPWRRAVHWKLSAAVGRGRACSAAESDPFARGAWRTYPVLSPRHIAANRGWL